MPCGQHGHALAERRGSQGRADPHRRGDRHAGHERGAQRYSVIVAGPLDWLEDRIEKFRNRLTVALALAGIGLVAVTLFQVRFGLLPLRKIERGLAAVRSGEAEKLEGDLPAEIKPLQVELNALIQSNQDIVDRARTQVGNLAHALKTPLAVITNEAREEKNAFGRKVTEQAQIMRDQVSHYLDRARMAAGVGVIGRVTQATPSALVRALERIQRAQGADHCRLPARHPLSGREAGLRGDVGNLLTMPARGLQGVPERRAGRVATRSAALTRRDRGGRRTGLTADGASRGGASDQTQPARGALHRRRPRPLLSCRLDSRHPARRPAGGLSPSAAQGTNFRPNRRDFGPGDATLPRALHAACQGTANSQRRTRLCACAFA
jgi:signal transduction histidine kinase